MITPPLPPGFQIDTPAPVAAGGVPPLPSGFQLDSTPTPASPAPVPLNNLTAPAIGPREISLMNPFWTAMHGVENTGSDILGVIKQLSQPNPIVQDMKPGVGRALASQVTLPNALLAGLGAPEVRAVAATPLGRAVMALLGAKFAKEGAEAAGTYAGTASAEPAGGQRREDITNAGLAGLMSLGGPALMHGAFTPEEPRVSGLKASDITSRPVYQQLPPNLPRRFVASPEGVADVSKVGQAEVYQPKKTYGGEIPTIGQGLPITQPSVHILPPNEVEGPRPPVAASYQASGEPKQGGQVSFESPAKAGAVPSARQAAVDPSALLPAIQTEKGLLEAKPNEITHADVLKANGIDPESIPHEDPRRGFVVNHTFLTRKQAEKLSGVQGTAEAGGLDSMDLPRANPEYSPEDLAVYQQLKPKTVPKTPEEFSSPEFQENWRQFEQLRNKYGGMPPKQLETQTKQPIEVPNEAQQQRQSSQQQYSSPTERTAGEQQPSGASPGNAPQQESIQRGASGGEAQRGTAGSEIGGLQRGGVLGEKPTPMFSGVPLPDLDWVGGRKFVSKAEKVLRDSAAIGFAKGASVDADQLKNRLRNKLGESSTEWEMLKGAGVDSLKGKMTSEQMADWVKERMPKVEVSKFGEGAVGPATKTFRELEHSWFDRLQHHEQRELEAAGSYQNFKGGNALEERLQEHKWSPEKIVKAREYLNAQNAAFKEPVGSNWQSIAPKSEQDMPGYTEIAVVKPVERVKITSRKQYAADQGIQESEINNDLYRAYQQSGGDFPREQSPSSHFFSPNTLGFARGYMETLPNGKKVFHVIEVQSDWAQRVRKENERQDRLEQGGGAQRSLARFASQKATTATDPLLKHYERLVLKAAIEHARNEGADAIAVQDSKSTMMQEGHDRIIENATRKVASYNKDAEKYGENAKGQSVYIELLDDDFGKYGAKFGIQGGKIVMTTRPFEAGMDLHYDQTLPKIAGELTGEKGESVSFGTHKMATSDTPGNDAAQIYDDVAEGLITPAEARIRLAQPKYRKDLIFRNPSGQPKTDVTARMFPIAKPAEQLAAGDPFTLTGKMFSGIPPLDPEAFKPMIEKFNKWYEGRKKTKLPSNRPLGWNPYFSMTKEQREKEILSNPAANKIEDEPQFRAQPGQKTPVMAKVANKITQLTNAAKRVDKIVLPRDAMLDMLDGGKGSYDGPLSQLFGWNVDDAFNRRSILVDRIIRKLGDIQKDGKLDKQNGERIGVYAIAAQEGGRQRLIESGVSPKVIDDIVKGLTPAERKWYDQYRKIDEELFPHVQRLAKELYGVDVKHVENHFPYMRDYQLVKPEPPEMVQPTEGGQTEDVVALKELMADFAASTKGTKTEQGFTISRLPNAKTPIRFDAFGVAQRHLTDVSNFITMQKILKESGEIARTDKFQEKYGQLGQQLVIDWLNTVARQGRFKRQSQFLGALRRNTSAGIIAFRLASQFVHTANIPLAVERTGGVGNWWNGLNDALSNEGQEFLTKNFRETFARGGGEPSLVEASRGPVTRAGFWVEQQIDRLNSQATVMGVYRKLLAEQGKNPDDWQTLPIDKEAIAKARVLSRRAVASPLYKDLPTVLARGSDWTRLFFQFQNTFLDQWSNIRYDLAGTRIGEFVKAAQQGKIDTGKAKQIATLAAALSVMVFWETSVRYEAKEGEERATGHGGQEPGAFWKRLGEDALKRVPGVGQTLAMMQYGESGFPLVDTVKDLATEARTTVDAAETGQPEKAKLAAVKTATEIGELAGVPGTSQASELVQDVMTSSPGLADRSQMYTLARKWMSQNKIKAPDQGDYPESKYLELNNALRSNDITAAKKAYEKLKSDGESPDRIKRYYNSYASRGFTNSETNEARFIQSLTPEQSVVYKRARQSNDDVSRRFTEGVLGERYEAPTAKGGERSVKVEEGGGAGRRQRKTLKLFAQ